MTTHPISTLLIQLCRAHRKTAESHLNAIGLYAGQEAILLLLLAQEGLSQSELAGALGVEAPTMTKAVTRLEKAGLVERRPDPEDGRVSRVYLTESGRGLEDDIHAVWSAIEAQVTGGLTEVEQALLQRLLPQMRDNLQSE